MIIRIDCYGFNKIIDELSLVKNIKLDVYPRKNKEKLTKDEMKQLSEFCSGWREFYLRNHGNIFNRL